MRSYQESHPWITFKATDINRLHPSTWMELGEARSKCEYLADAPLRPDVADQLIEVAVVRGAQATTAIEGNTLTEEQVLGILHETFKAPPSREYQEREVKNVLDEIGAIFESITAGDQPVISKDFICQLNRKVLERTDYAAHIKPGRVRDYSVGVANYLGPPAEDCDYLLDRLAGWLESDTFQCDDPTDFETRFALSVASAIYAHLYIAWIHPFGDGNGRTARLLELLILAKCRQVPLLATLILSNHYNLTRDRYYRELHDATATDCASGFIAYAIQGFRDGLRDQVEDVLDHQVKVAWINYVHETMNRSPSSPARERQRTLILAMPFEYVVPQDELTGLTRKLATLYAKTGPRTLSRDLNKLREAGLVEKRREGWRSNNHLMNAFVL